MLTEEVKKRILTNVLETIDCISDKEYQIRVWIRGEGPEVDDFDETCCSLFNDYDCDYLIENYKDFGVTDHQCEILKSFRDQFRVFSDDNYWPPEFIDTPEWAKIMDLAKDVLKAFKWFVDEN